MDKPATPVQGRKEERHDFTDYIEELKNRLDIVQVAELHGITVNNRGQAECFHGHDEKTASLELYQDSQSYHCFGCSAHGDVISLVQNVDGCSFMEAVNRLANEAGLEAFQSDNGYDADQYGRVSDCLNAAAATYHSWLQHDDPYLKGRGVSYQTAQSFMIGRTRGRQDLCSALEKRGFDASTVSLGIGQNRRQGFLSRPYRL